MYLHNIKIITILYYNERFFTDARHIFTWNESAEQRACGVLVFDGWFGWYKKLSTLLWIKIRRQRSVEYLYNIQMTSHINRNIKFVLYLGLFEAIEDECRVDGYENFHFTIIYPYIVDTGLCKKPKIR